MGISRQWHFACQLQVELPDNEVRKDAIGRSKGHLIIVSIRRTQAPNSRRIEQPKSREERRVSAEDFEFRLGPDEYTIHPCEFTRNLVGSSWATGLR